MHRRWQVGFFVIQNFVDITQKPRGVYQVDIRLENLTHCSSVLSPSYYVKLHLCDTALQLCYD